MEKSGDALLRRKQQFMTLEAIVAAGLEIYSKSLESWQKWQMSPRSVGGCWYFAVGQSGGQTDRQMFIPGAMLPTRLKIQNLLGALFSGFPVSVLIHSGAVCWVSRDQKEKRCGFWSVCEGSFMS